MSLSACIIHSWGQGGNARARCGESDYRLLFEALGLGMTDEEIARHTDRGVRGVRSRARMLVDRATSQKAAVSMLRRLAEAPDFDWDAWVRAAHHREKLPYWDTAADQALITHWASEPPPRIEQLCEQFDVDQEVVVRRAIILGLATTRAEVVDRFGARPGSALALNALLAKDKLAAAVVALTVTDPAGAVLHLSLHPTTEDAHDSLNTLDAAALAGTPGRWTIATRVVGEGSVRATDTGYWSDLADTPTMPAQPIRWWRRLRTARPA